MRLAARRRENVEIQLRIARARHLARCTSKNDTQPKQKCGKSEQQRRNTLRPTSAGREERKRARQRAAKSSPKSNARRDTHAKAVEVNAMAGLGSDDGKNGEPNQKPSLLQKTQRVSQAEKRSRTNDARRRRTRRRETEGRKRNTRVGCRDETRVRESGRVIHRVVR